MAEPAVALRRITLRATMHLVLAGALLAAGAVTASPAAEASVTPLPACRTGDAISPWRALGQFRVTILDRWYRLPSTYVPPLRSVSAAGFPAGYSVRREVIPDLAAMRLAAARAGARLGVISAYRSYLTQRWTYAKWVRILGAYRASISSARAGHSEHQLGTAIDFTVPGAPAPWNYADWARTRAGAWLKANAWRYGFVMSYPANRLSVTCYEYEPWHYRWVGREIAAKIRASGLAPRPWLWRYGAAYAWPAPSPTPTPTPTPEPSQTPEPTPTPTPEPSQTPEPTPTPTPTPTPEPSQTPEPTTDPSAGG
ncbi:MAG: M15 family metallopeptidase [Chloroflexi bacterium]|jgi:D-alanyl-D-alanine carboxypeptidase|nr:M15 family metallopeptidase [Chloroflexota bacterium]